MKGYLNRSRAVPTRQDHAHRLLVEAGLRQEWREGVSGSAPVDEGRAIAAAHRAVAAGKQAYSSQPAAYAQPNQAAAFGGSAPGLPGKEAS